MEKRINVKIFSDGELVQNYLSGDKSAVETLIQRHSARLYNYIAGMVADRSSADDIMQETFLKAVASIERGKYNDDGRFVSWLMRIAHNQVIDYFRVNKRRREVASEDSVMEIASVRSMGYDTGAEGKIIREQTAAQLQKLVDSLPKEQREVVVMRHFMNLSFKEIAEQTGVSINTALGRMRYALKNLRKEVDTLGLELA
ncbi:MAG: sigma-70 family RNA polymerase sigma factor [Rikenellaceae bacterium]